MENKDKKEDQTKKVGGIIESNFDESVETFDELNLKLKILHGIYGYSFEKPSIIQQKAILLIIQGK